MSSEKNRRMIVGQPEFEQVCQEAAAAGLVAFDTEFVSEYTYRPELCLLQIATPERSVAVDPFAVDDLSPWWELMTDDRTTIVVHGGQAEIRFCWERTGLPPRKLIDVQLVEGLNSRSYPLSYTNLVARVLGHRVHGKETRTDWRRRPLTEGQIQYALEDVEFLPQIWAKQAAALKSLGRLDWAESELQRFVTELAEEFTREAWTKLPGVHRLNRRELAVVRELSRCRDDEAEERNKPVRRILRDDLLVEIARREPRTLAELMATRDMDRGDYRRFAPAMLAAVERGLAVPEADLPEPVRALRSEASDDEHILGKFLGMALANRCAELNVAMSLVGTSADLRHLVRWHVYGERQGPPPRLMEGWRAEVCGDLLTDVLDGRITLRVADPESDHPLRFERAAIDGLAENGAPAAVATTDGPAADAAAATQPSGRKPRKPAARRRSPRRPRGQ